MTIVKTKKCSTHNCRLRKTKTQYGTRWECPHEGCTVICWGGQTSTPADAATRYARTQAHEAFDSVWKSGELTRSQCYRWLAKQMRLPKGKCHIGMFDAAECERVIWLVEHRKTTTYYPKKESISQHP